MVGNGMFCRFFGVCYFIVDFADAGFAFAEFLFVVFARFFNYFFATLKGACWNARFFATTSAALTLNSGSSSSDANPNWEFRPFLPL